MKKQIVMLIWIFILAFAAYMMSGCKTKDVVTYTYDGWKIHSNIPVDTLK